MVKLTSVLAVTAWPFHGVHALATAFGGQQLGVADSARRDALQNLVTWDEHSLFVRGERIMFYSGEFHPFRLPVPGLWLDIFHKIKALGYTGASFYVDWRLLEGERGRFTADGVFAFAPFFAAAAEAGLYLLARPGPYINAEVAGGGFPGWLQREGAILRTNESGYVDATRNYVAHIGGIIADAQITNGGPVIALQAENEYTYGASWVTWPDVKYIEQVNQLYRDAGIVVPFINNEASPIGLFTPGEPGGPDIYGHDSYPIGWTCSEPSNWTAGALPTNFRELHLEQSPETPYAIPEFQGGAIAYWGGSWDLDQCAALVGPEAERVFYKNNLGFGINIFNLYMTYGGTNWGNLGQPGAYTSYDYGAAIKEDRTLFREKYAEAKLIAQFVKASPAYLDATPGTLTNTSYVSTPEIATTPVFGSGSGSNDTTTTNFYVTRHSDYTSLDATPYTFTVPTSAGLVTIPQLGGTLTLQGRDAKVHVTDYDVGGYNLVYSSADVYTHGRSAEKRVLLLYGLAGETHEFALPSALGTPTVVEGDDDDDDEDNSTVRVETLGATVVVQWDVTEARKVLHYGSLLDVYLLWRNDAFDYWVLELEAPAPVGNYTARAKDTVIARAGYLLRTASVSGTSLYLTGDLNATTPLEIIAGFPPGPSSSSSSSSSNDTVDVDIYFNGAKLAGVESSPHGLLSTTLTYSAPPTLTIPDLSALAWTHIDSLPELHPTYDDTAWPRADHPTTPNDARDDDDDGTVFALRTPTSLVAGDYGFHTGSLVYRGHFTAGGDEAGLYLATQGGAGFGHSVWVNATYLGSFDGAGVPGGVNQTLDIPSGLLVRGGAYVITVVIDHMGEETNWTPGYDMMKTPRGILDYALLSSHPQTQNQTHNKTSITWKLTGNLRGESYADQTRGPLNEGGLYAERQGYHLPHSPAFSSSSSSNQSPAPALVDGVVVDKRNPVTEGVAGPGVGFFAAEFALDIPPGWDVPLGFAFANGSAAPARYRAQLFVNGYQFGKYINNLGPQTLFPVPQGILNYRGPNAVALTLWSQEEGGARLGGFKLVVAGVIQSGMRDPGLSPMPGWIERAGAY